VLAIFFFIHSGQKLFSAFNVTSISCINTRVLQNEILQNGCVLFGCNIIIISNVGHTIREGIAASANGFEFRGNARPITFSRGSLRPAPILAIRTRHYLQAYRKRSMKLSIKQIIPTLESNGLCSLYVFVADNRQSAV
jgi:hypothetical protein